MSGAEEHSWFGTENQIQWADKIRQTVSEEFDRVLKALQDVALRQTELDRQDTRAMIGILEEKRTQVLGHTGAGYFIKNWQELTDQVRKLLRDDPRYEAIKRAKLMRAEKLQTRVLPGMEGPCSE